MKVEGLAHSLKRGWFRNQGSGVQGFGGSGLRALGVGCLLGEEVCVEALKESAHIEEVEDHVHDVFAHRLHLGRHL